MKSIILALSLVAVATCAPQYVWDLLKPALNAAEVQQILSDKSGQWPTLNSIPDSNFDCSSKAQPGFYADQSAQCQVFHRCDINGNRTSYLCVNTTVFNQITLICDYFFNVDCSRAKQFENFANSRLYTDQPLFDTPPADYVAPQNGVVPVNARPAPVRPVGKPAAKATTKAAARATTTTTLAADEESTEAAAARVDENQPSGDAAQASGEAQSVENAAPENAPAQE